MLLVVPALESISSKVFAQHGTSSFVHLVLAGAHVPRQEVETMHATMLHAVCAPPCTTVRISTSAKTSAVPCVSFLRASKPTRRQLSVARAVQVATTADADAVETAYLTARTNIIRQHFDGALSVDDVRLVVVKLDQPDIHHPQFFARVEVALAAYGFSGDNTIACSNVCRDEITITAKNKIDAIFGSSFNTNGLGGVLTCGVTGFKAGLSHSPICGSGKERYTFFSFPHISIDAAGNVGAISRPGRPGASCACGALIGSLVQIKEAGLAASCKKPGVHDYADPELSILKQRLARRMRYEGWTEQQVQEMDLVDITKIAERTISDDLEYLVKNAVDPTKADYAVVTGVQIHNYGTEFDNAEPNLEYIWPTGIYVVVNGEKTYIDLDSIPVRVVSGHAKGIVPLSSTGIDATHAVDHCCSSIAAQANTEKRGQLRWRHHRTLNRCALPVQLQ